MVTQGSKRARLIAYYLPQFHRIPENDRWWGQGFTEWTNVARARPMFRAHYQPRLPSELGFYDLRVPDARAAQAELAQSHGVEGFCYWHYWFAGKRLLERPFSEVLASGEPHFPFCLAWGNQTWTGKWHGAPDQVLIAQTYPGERDHRAHFYALLPALTDDRYISVNGMPLFLVQRPHEMPESRRYTDLWRELAIKEGLKGIYFVGLGNPGWKPQESGFDASAVDNPGWLLWLLERDPHGKLRRAVQHLYDHSVGGFPRAPTVYSYEDVLRYALPPLAAGFEQYPCAIPNWDNTPRSGKMGVVFHNSTPESFARHLEEAIQQVAHREPDKRIVFIKSWNEWAEGNYLEPDQRFGRAYLEAIRSAVSLELSDKQPGRRATSHQIGELVPSDEVDAASSLDDEVQRAPDPVEMDPGSSLRPPSGGMSGPRIRRRVLVFFPQQLYPSQSGFHRRGLSILAGLRELDCDTTLLSMHDANHSPWDGNTVALLTQRERLAKDVHLYYQSEADHKLIVFLTKWYRLGHRTAPIDSALHCTTAMQRWFSEAIEDSSPDVILWNYAFYDRLLDHQRFASTIRAIDSIDVLTQTREMWHTLERRLPPPPINPNQVDEHLLDEDFFDRLRPRMDLREARIYDRYNHTIAISPRDAEIIARNVRKTNVLWIPMTYEPQLTPNTYAQSALFATGPNPFNLQGLLYFMKRILPLVRRRAPDFTLQVTGWCSGRVVPSDGVVMRGFVPDLDSVYKDTRFAVCPIFGGTGQAIKIIEALAYGVPVVALRHSAAGSPILKHGENGFIADDAVQFADYVIELWNDRSLCSRMGQSARESVAQQLASKTMLHGLERIVMKPSDSGIQGDHDA